MSLQIDFHPDRTSIFELLGETRFAGAGYVDGNGNAGIPYSDGGGEVSAGASGGGQIGFRIISGSQAKITSWTVYVEMSVDGSYNWETIYSFANTQLGAGNPNNVLPVNIDTSIHFTNSRGDRFVFPSSGVKYFRFRLDVSDGNIPSQSGSSTTPFTFKVYCNPKGTRCPVITSCDFKWGGNGWYVIAHTLNNSGTVSTYRAEGYTTDPWSGEIQDILSPSVTVGAGRTADITIGPFASNTASTRNFEVRIVNGCQSPVLVTSAGVPGGQTYGATVTDLVIDSNPYVTDPISPRAAITVVNKGDIAVRDWSVSLIVTNMINGVSKVYRGPTYEYLGAGATQTIYMMVPLPQTDPEIDVDVIAVVV